VKAVFSFDDVAVSFPALNAAHSANFRPRARNLRIPEIHDAELERLISREELLREVWDYQNYPRTRTVNTHMLKLRQKLERDPSDPVHFKTVHSFAYKFVP
jgi:DNA-binding response OmpR family regulator